MNKRNFTRVEFTSEAFVKCHRDVVKGDVENLSLTGMFLKTEEKLELNEFVDIKIFLSGASSQLQINLKGIVVRHSEAGVGIRFNEMDLDSFIHIKNIVALNEGDEDKIMNEFSDYMKQKEAKEEIF